MMLRGAAVLRPLVALEIPCAEDGRRRWRSRGRRTCSGPAGHVADLSGRVVVAECGRAHWAGSPVRCGAPSRAATAGARRRRRGEVRSRAESQGARRRAGRDDAANNVVVSVRSSTRFGLACRSRRTNSSSAHLQVPLAVRRSPLDSFPLPAAFSPPPRPNAGAVRSCRCGRCKMSATIGRREHWHQPRRGRV